MELINNNLTKKKFILYTKKLYKEEGFKRYFVLNQYSPSYYYQKFLSILNNEEQIKEMIRFLEASKPFLRNFNGMYFNQQ